MKIDLFQPGGPPVPVMTEMDACELLDADHIAVKHLFVDYSRLAMTLLPKQGADRASIALRICDELTVHAQIEEEIFYPALRAALPDAQDLLEEAEAEHAEVKAMVAQIRGLGKAGPEMDKLVTELAGCVEHHVKEERTELFPKAKASSGLDLVELARELKAAQAQVKQG
jgi:Hemerythrin HHE cation binding domain